MTITETLTLDISVMADSRKEAERKAMGNWKDGVYILDADNFTKAIFEAVPMNGWWPEGIDTEKRKDGVYGRT